MALAECSRTGSLFEITLSRPDAGNALDAALVEALHAALDELSTTNCTAVLFRGAGKGFCGGFDLIGIENESDASLLARFIRIELLLQRIVGLPQTTVAMAHGFAFGAGADLMLACRRRIAAPRTRLSFPGVRFGIALGSARLGRLAGADKAWAILARSSPVDAEEALALGLLSEVVESEHWHELTEQLAQMQSALDPMIGGVIAGLLNFGNDDADLAALVRSAAQPGLKKRLLNYRETVAMQRHSERSARDR